MNQDDYIVLSNYKTSPAGKAQLSTNTTTSWSSWVIQSSSAADDSLSWEIHSSSSSAGHSSSCDIQSPSDDNNKEEDTSTYDASSSYNNSIASPRWKISGSSTIFSHDGVVSAIGSCKKKQNDVESFSLAKEILTQKKIRMKTDTVKKARFLVFLTMLVIFCKQGFSGWARSGTKRVKNESGIIDG